MKTNLSTNLTMNFNAIALIFSMVTVLAIPMAAHAQAPDRKPADASADQRPPHEPPPQAYTSCKNKKEGDIVQIVTPRDEKLSATCTASSKGLFARPERPPQRNEHASGNPPAKK
jgi:hypothetical protein